MQAYPSENSLICDFYPSDQGFAYSFFQTPPHDGHPCCSAICFPLSGCIRDFHPQESAHGGHTKTAIIIFAMMAVTYSILSYLIFISENDFYFLFLVPCRLCMLSDDLLLIFFARSFKSTIHVSLHILIRSLNMWYSVQYVCSSFYRPVYIFSVYSFLLNLLYRPFIYYNKGLFSGNFYLPYH